MFPRSLVSELEQAKKERASSSAGPEPMTKKQKGDTYDSEPDFDEVDRVGVTV